MWLCYHVYNEERCGCVIMYIMRKGVAVFKCVIIDIMRKGVAVWGQWWLRVTVCTCGACPTESSSPLSGSPPSSRWCWWTGTGGFSPSGTPWSSSWKQQSLEDIFSLRTYFSNTSYRIFKKNYFYFYIFIFYVVLLY